MIRGKTSTATDSTIIPVSANIRIAKTGLTLSATAPIINEPTGPAPIARLMTPSAQAAHLVLGEDQNQRRLHGGKARHASPQQEQMGNDTMYHSDTEKAKSASSDRSEPPT